MENIENEEDFVGAEEEVKEFVPKEFIGDRGIKHFEAIEGGSQVIVEFVDGYKATLSGTLFFHLKTDEKGQGNVTDNVNHYFAKKFLSELSLNGLEYYMVDNVGTAMRVLAHNLREEAIKKAFRCSGGDSIRLNDLIPE